MNYQTDDDELNDIKIGILKFTLFFSSIVFSIYSVIFLFKGGGSRAYFPEFIASQLSVGRGIAISLLFSALLALSAWWCYQMLTDLRTAKHYCITIFGLAIMSLLTGNSKLIMLIMLGIAYFVLKNSDSYELFTLNRNNKSPRKSIKETLFDLKEGVFFLFFDLVENDPSDENVPEQVSEELEPEELVSTEEKETQRELSSEVTFVDEVIKKAMKDRERAEWAPAYKLIERHQAEQSTAEQSSEEVSIIDEVSIEEKTIFEERVIDRDSEDMIESYLSEDEVTPQLIVTRPEIIIVDRDNPSHLPTSSVSEIPCDEDDVNDIKPEETTDALSVVTIHEPIELESIEPEVTPEPKEQPIEREVVEEVPRVQETPPPPKPKTLGQIQKEFEEGLLSSDEYESAKQAYLERQMSRIKR